MDLWRFVFKPKRFWKSFTDEYEYIRFPVLFYLIRFIILSCLISSNFWFLVWVHLNFWKKQTHIFIWTLWVHLNLWKKQIQLFIYIWPENSRKTHGGRKLAREDDRNDILARNLRYPVIMIFLNTYNKFNSKWCTKKKWPNVNKNDSSLPS